MTDEVLHNVEHPHDGLDSAPIGAHSAPAAPADAAEIEHEAALETPSGAEGATTSPATTAEIDLEEVEARLSDPGSTQSFQAIPEERIDTDSTYDAGTTANLMWGARSDVGCVRTHNEDSYLVQSPLFCVSDGMGGHAAGEVASSIAVETIAKHAPTAADPTLLARAVESANTAIIEAAAEGVGRPGMGCTATVAYIEGTQLAIAHVGDSRAYLVHEGTLIRVTRDHSYVEELVDAGEITADEARVHPNRSVITRALGSDPAMYADHFQLNIEEGDRLILCSDGLSSMISDGEIETIANQSPTAQICVDNLVDAALAAGGSDNVTVLVVDVVDDRAEFADPRRFPMARRCLTLPAFEDLAARCGIGRHHYVAIMTRGHSFDRSAAGYVHLLPPNQKHSAAPGDDRGMAAARRDFLSKGYYAPLLNTLCCQILSLSGDFPVIWDVGCGEGYYTAGIYQALTAAGRSPRMAGTDLSKSILRYAARRERGIEWAVASSYHLPAADETADVLLDCFSPLALEEFRRVL